MEVYHEGNHWLAVVPVSVSADPPGSPLSQPQSATAAAATCAAVNDPPHPACCPVLRPSLFLRPPHLSVVDLSGQCRPATAACPRGTPTPRSSPTSNSQRPYTRTLGGTAVPITAAGGGQGASPLPHAQLLATLFPLMLGEPEPDVAKGNKTKSPCPDHREKLVLRRQRYEGRMQNAWAA